jgi:cytochrome P450
VADFETVDLLTDPSLVENPHRYFEHLRKKGAAVRLPHHGVVATVGYDAALAVFRDDERFSALNAVGGPYSTPAFPQDLDDISEQIEAARGQMAFTGLIATQDPPTHSKIRSLLMGVITPKRLKENETFMWRLADQQIDRFIGRGGFEVAKDFGGAYTALVIADLLGVPEEDHATFEGMMHGMSGAAMPGQLTSNANADTNPLEAMGMYFFKYLSERRVSPRPGALTDLALAKYPDGSTPEIIDVVGLATFLFAAGRDTAVRLITAALRFVAEDPELQRRLRTERALIPNFLEEVLRLEGAVKANFRLAKVPVKVGELELPPGTAVMQITAAANRDPARFERPDELLADRKNARDHLSFGRGVHACPGAPLARAEAKVALERLFDRTGDLRINERAHGPAGARRFEYEPNYMFRGLTELHLDFTPAA